MSTRVRIFFSRRHLLDVIDFVVIVLSFIANIVTIAYESEYASTLKLLTAFRAIRVVMFIRFVNEKRNMEKAARKVIRIKTGGKNGAPRAQRIESEYDFPND